LLEVSFRLGMPSSGASKERGFSDAPGQIWIEEIANRHGTLGFIAGVLILVLALAIEPFAFGGNAGYQFLFQGLTFQAGAGWWIVSFAVYLELLGIFVMGALALNFHFRAQIVKVGISNSGVVFFSRTVQQSVPWDRLLPNPDRPTPGHPNYGFLAFKDGSDWRTRLFVVGPRAGAAVIQNSHFPQPRRRRLSPLAPLAGPCPAVGRGIRIARASAVCESARPLAFHRSCRSSVG